MTEAIAAARIVDAKLRTDFATFLYRVFKELVPATDFDNGWYLEAMIHELMQIRSGGSSRLLITMPPRHLKSITASIAFPAWCIGHNPGQKFLVVSYNDKLAADLSRDFKKVIGSVWYRRAFPWVDFSRVTDTDVETSKGGRRMGVSRGGGITGFGAHVIIIDDLMKAVDATSAVERERVNSTYGETLMSRFEDQSASKIIALQQRLHEDDFANFLMEKGIYNHLNLPAIATEEAVIQLGGGRTKLRRVGELLSARQSREKLEEMRAEMTPSVFEAQYQQNPTSADGNLVRWDTIQTYAQAPTREQLSRVIQSWDTAMTTTGSWSVCTTWGEFEGCWHLLDVGRWRVEFGELLALVKARRDEWEPDYLVIEKAASGHQLLDMLGAEMRRAPIIRRRRFESSGCKLRGEPPTNSKVERFVAQVTRLQTGFAKFPERAPWLSDLKREFTAFPNGKHDDQVDSVSQFLKFAGELRRSQSRLRVA